MFGTVSLAATKFQAIGQQSRKSLVKPIPVYPEVAKRLNLEGYGKNRSRSSVSTPLVKSSRVRRGFACVEKLE